MPTVIELPDQTEVEFPDDMSSANIARVINRYSQPGQMLYSLFNPEILEPYREPVREMALDVLPVTGHMRGAERMGDIATSFQEKSPIGKVLSAADFTLEGAGLAADVLPITKGVAAALGSVSPLIPMMARRGGDLTPLQKAFRNEIGKITYHGSPHKFSKFDHAMMGSGEGAQAYGWGTYLADSPKVAQQYTDSFRAQGGIWVTDEPLSPLAESTANSFRTDLKGAIKHLKQQKKEFPIHKTLGDMRPKYDEAIEQIQRLQDSGTFQKEPFFYEVDLPDDQIEKMLDWDAPLSEQPEGVQTAVREIIAEKGGSDRYWLEKLGENPDGQKIVHELRLGDDRGFSEKLLSHGVPGIKYWDGGSRAAGEGTRNYVVFDENIMQIVRRNDEAID